MRRVHLLRVVNAPLDFAPLISASRARGMRLGWLELAEVTPPERLAVAASLGVLRAVAAGSAQTVTVKPRRAAAVLDDLLREHFRGCVAVLVVGDVECATLTPSGQGWTVARSARRSHSYTTDELVDALRSPRPLVE